MADGSRIQTFFKDAVLKDVPMTGDNVAQSNGVDIRGGQAGTSRTMPEVSTINVKDDSAPGIMGGKNIAGAMLPGIKQ